MKPDSFHLAAGDGDEDFRQGRASSDAALGAEVSLFAVQAALSGALDEWARNVCEHEETMRGGSIWTFCCGCSAKWADDEGGIKPYVEPARITTAYSVLSRVRAAIAKATSNEQSASGSPLREGTRPDAKDGAA